jgi:DNA-binding transcriptional LysR family regulator
MKAKELTNLYWFCQSVKYGGFSGASLYVNASAPTLSRAVAQLELTLGEKLLYRNAKHFQLTSSGEKYYQQFSTLFRQLDENWLLLSDDEVQLTGHINLSCPEPFADYFLQPIAIEFMKLHKKVNVHFTFAADADRFFDQHIDLAVVTSPLVSTQLIQRKLFQSELSLAASPSYLSESSHLSCAADLVKHKLIAGNTMSYWEFLENNNHIKVPLSPAYSINSLRLAIKAACAGVGICLMPTQTLSSFVKSGQLQAVLPQLNCVGGDVYMLWADRELVPARVSAFKDFIFKRIEQSDSFFSACINQELADK